MSKDTPIAPPDRLLQAFDFATELDASRRAHDETMRALLLDLLDAMDSFERFEANEPAGGVPAAEKAAQWWRTLHLISRRLRCALEAAGVVAAPCIGQPANPTLHEIIDARPAPGVENGIILEELTRGYRRHDQVLRPARVIIARNHQETTL